MPDCKTARVVVLCEDLRHYHFVRGFLTAKGLSPHKITPRLAPPGTGSAEDYVRQNFPAELQAHRSAHGNVILIVCIDQDKPGINSTQELGEECANQQIPTPTTQDNLLILVPNRNIETWLYLIQTNQSIDEKQNYKLRIKNPKPGKLGTKLATQCHQLNLPPSLQTAKNAWQTLCP